MNHFDRLAPVAANAIVVEVWHSLLWDPAILVVAVPLAVRLYRRAV